MNPDIPVSNVVYAHGISGDSGWFHIGSGSEQRARTLTNRSSEWHRFVDEHGGASSVRVEILERLACPARARLREMQLIGIHQCATNKFGRSSIPPAILDARPKGAKERCACGSPDCYGNEVRGSLNR